MVFLGYKQGNSIQTILAFERSDISYAIIAVCILCIALTLFVNRRRIKWILRLTNSYAWLPRRYVGPNTLFPQRRRTGCLYYIREWEDAPYYEGTMEGRVMLGRHERRLGINLVDSKRESLLSVPQATGGGSDDSDRVSHLPVRSCA